MTGQKANLHSIQALYKSRKQQSTKPFNARGKQVVRCEYCQMAEKNCICQLRHMSKSTAAFLIIMHDAEVLKPSNTARLIADVVSDTHAFIWSRTEPDENMLALINDTNYMPMVVFPSQYAGPRQVVCEEVLPETHLSNKIPLFILLDGSWREAKKMFRKSPYLAELPMLSFNEESKTHYIREAQIDNQFATAQVAAKALAVKGDHVSAEHLALWFDVFNYQYQKSVCQLNRGRDDALEEYRLFCQKEYK